MKWFTILALALAIGLATAASPFASSSPDGLERVAADKGFAPRARAGDGRLLDYGRLQAATASPASPGR